MPRKTRLNESDIQREVSRGVRSLMDFTKMKTVMNVVESVRTNRFDMSESDLATLTNIVELSIEQSFTNGYKEIEVAVKNLSERL